MVLYADTVSSITFIKHSSRLIPRVRKTKHVYPRTKMLTASQT